MSEALLRARGAASRLKVFPLPQVVLLPGTAMPLHIFEERYREMVRDALASDGIFSMAQVLPGQEAQLTGRPQLEPIVCVGSIAAHAPLDDGCSDLVLIGVARARIEAELPSARLYREVAAELVLDAPLPAGASEEVELRQAVMELVARLPQEVGARIAAIATRATGGNLADVVAGAVMEDAPRRYEVLCELDVRERMRLVARETLALVGSLRARGRDGLMN